MRMGPFTSCGRLVKLGLTAYQDACDVQLRLHQARAANRIEDVLILTEHLPVYTLGRTARPEHVGAGWQATMINEIPVCLADRGGSVTYHGPGQLVGYPILAIRRHCPGPKVYIGLLEEVVIRTLERLAITGGRRPGFPGVWVNNRKIAAIGVRISEGVTRHGFSLNVTNDLSPFSAIVPCGLVGCTVTSVAMEAPGGMTFDTATQAVVQEFQEVFGMSLLEKAPDCKEEEWNLAI
jgi:lipoyl(octanoyl) transferase